MISVRIFSCNIQERNFISQRSSCQDVIEGIIRLSDFSPNVEWDVQTDLRKNWHESWSSCFWSAWRFCLWIRFVRLDEVSITVWFRFEEVPLKREKRSTVKLWVTVRVWCAWLLFLSKKKRSPVDESMGCPRTRSQAGKAGKVLRQKRPWEEKRVVLKSLRRQVSSWAGIWGTLLEVSSRESETRASLWNAQHASHVRNYSGYTRVSLVL